MTRHPFAKALPLALAAAGLALGPDPAPAQQFKSREEVNNHYDKEFAALEGRHIADLAAVAAAERGEQAEATYRLLFSLAIARNLYPAAEPAAEAIMDKEGVSPDLNALAHFINAVAEADQGKYAESLEHLQDFIKDRALAGDEGRRLPPETLLAVGEAYFQRLVEAGQYEVAAKFVDFAVEHARNPAVKGHFAERQKRIGMLGRPAPALAAKDIDGKDVKLADYEGKVVLVEFWATWCPPCGPQMLRLNGIREQYKDRGFEVIGVNVDALRDGAGDPEAVLSNVRRFLVDLGVAWPNILNGDERDDIAAAFGVTQIPANFLIGRDGKIAGFEIGDSGLEEAVSGAIEGKQNQGGR